MVCVLVCVFGAKKQQQHNRYECANQTDGYIFELVPGKPLSVANPGIRSYTPSFTYHGFRFMQATAKLINPSTGVESLLSPDLAKMFPFGLQAVALRRNSDVNQMASVSIGAGQSRQDRDDAGQTNQTIQTNQTNQNGDLIQNIFDATLASHVSNLWTIPTDCPQREKRGWMGDAGLSATSLNSFFDAFSFHTNFLRLIRDAQRKQCWDQPSTSIYGPCTSQTHQFYNGSVPDVTPFPTGPYGGNPGTNDWQTAYPLIAHALLEAYPSRSVEILSDLWPSLDLFMQYLSRNLDNSTHLLLAGSRGDWIPPVYNGRIKTPASLVGSFFHTLCLRYMADIATAIGLPQAASRFHFNNFFFCKQFLLFIAISAVSPQDQLRCAGFY